MPNDKAVELYNEPQNGAAELEVTLENDPFLLRLKAVDAKMDAEYARQLAEEKRPEALQIRMADIRDGDGSVDHRIRRELEIITKYGEYTKRLKDEGKTESDFVFTSDWYKREVARLTIGNREVNTWALGKAIQAAMGACDAKRFENACGVVHSYIRDGGGNVVGGTGLPNFSGRGK